MRGRRLLSSTNTKTGQRHHRRVFSASGGLEDDAERDGLTGVEKTRTLRDGEEGRFHDGPPLNQSSRGVGDSERGAPALAKKSLWKLQLFLVYNELTWSWLNLLVS